jgi:acyl carrier protein
MVNQIQPQADVLRAFHEAIEEVAPDAMLSAVTRETPLSDLGVDSLTMMQAVGILEDRLGIRLADEGVSRARTVGDLVDLVEHKPAGGH